MRCRAYGGVVGVACAACLLIGSPAMATPIAYGSFAGTVINFDDLAGSPTLGAGEALTNQYAGLGVTFLVPYFGAYASNGVLATNTALNSDPNVIWVNQGGGTGGASAQGLLVLFSQPVSRVGMYLEGSLGSTFSLAVFSGATLLEVFNSSLASGGAGLEGFMAIENAGITQVAVYSANGNGQNWNFSIDDLKFETATTSVPEPATLLLLGTGLALTAWRKRRQ